jgi:ribosome hibernation promoting factor
MQIQIHGKQVDVGAALRGQTESRIAAAVGKYFDRHANGTVTYSRENHGFRCDCLVHLSSGMTLQTSSSADEARIALDQAVERLEKRLRRYKGRLKTHHAKSEGPVETVMAQAYVIDDFEDEAGEEPADLEPVIVAELQTEVKSLTVGEAVMQMNLFETPALLFRHRGTGRLNMVYRRHDGHIGWIDPPAPSSERSLA